MFSLSVEIIKIQLFFWLLKVCYIFFYRNISIYSTDRKIKTEIVLLLMVKSCQVYCFFFCILHKEGKITKNVDWETNCLVYTKHKKIVEHFFYFNYTIKKKNTKILKNKTIQINKWKCWFNNLDWGTVEYGGDIE